jgi:cytochrome c5
MPIKLSYIAPLLAAAAAAAIATAPTAAADAASTQPTAIATAPAAVDRTSSFCTSLGGSATQCQTPGNTQINDAPPPVHYKPQWNDRYGGDPIPPYPTS